MSTEIQRGFVNNYIVILGELWKLMSVYFIFFFI